jgi:hypothetical protein
MEKAGLTNDDLAGALGVPVAALNGWLGGSIPIPAWVLPAVSVIELVTPEARRAPARKTVSSQPGYRHPFARIEEL